MYIILTSAPSPSRSKLVLVLLLLQILLLPLLKGLIHVLLLTVAAAPTTVAAELVLTKQQI